MAPQDTAAAADIAGQGEAPDRIGFATHPDRYRHWKLSVDGNVARLALDVAEAETLKPGVGVTKGLLEPVLDFLG